MLAPASSLLSLGTAMKAVKSLKANFVDWVEDVPGGDPASYAADPFKYRAQHLDTGFPRDPPAWGGSISGDPTGRKLDEEERTEADSCLPYGEKHGRFGTNEDLRVVGPDDDDDHGHDHDHHLDHEAARFEQQHSLQHQHSDFGIAHTTGNFNASKYHDPRFRDDGEDETGAFGVARRGGGDGLRGRGGTGFGDVHLAAQRRVWSFEVFPSSGHTTDSSRGGSGAKARDCAEPAREAGPRLHFCWHGHLPIFAVARPDPDFEERPGEWVVELYQVGHNSGSGGSSESTDAGSRGIPAVDGGDADRRSLRAFVGRESSNDRAAVHEEDGEPPFRLRLGKKKGEVRSIAFQPHGGANLLIGCTHSLWLAQFTMFESSSGGGRAANGHIADGVGGVRGYRVALAWLSCVYHCPPVVSFAAKLLRRVGGLGARTSANFLQDAAWSSDGSRLAACFSGEECLRVWDADLLVARDRVGAQPAHRTVAVPLCRDGLAKLSWSPSGAYLFAAHASDGRATVWETERWEFHQWDADCRTAAWASTAEGPSLGGRQVLLTVERAPLDATRDRKGSETTAKSQYATSPAREALVRRSQGPYTVIKAYAFSAATPLCEHENYAVDLGGEGLLDIRDDVARKLAQMQFQHQESQEDEEEERSEDDDEARTAQGASTTESSAAKRVCCCGGEGVLEGDT